MQETKKFAIHCNELQMDALRSRLRRAASRAAWTAGSSNAVRLERLNRWRRWWYQELEDFDNLARKQRKNQLSLIRTYKGLNQLRMLRIDLGFGDNQTVKIEAQLIRNETRRLQMYKETYDVIAAVLNRIEKRITELVAEEQQRLGIE